MQQMKEKRRKRKKETTKNRRQNFDEEENNNFVTIISKYKDILASQEVKLNVKNRAWLSIMEEFNRTSKIIRPVNCLRDKYSNLYMHLKKLVSNPYTAFINLDKRLVFSCQLPDYVWKFACLYYEMFPERVQQWMKEGNSGDIHIEYLDEEFTNGEVLLDESQGSGNMEISSFERESSMENSIKSSNVEKNESNESACLGNIDESLNKNIKIKRFKIEKKICKPEKESEQEIIESGQKIKEEIMSETEDQSFVEIQKQVWKQKAELVRLQIIEQRREMKRNREYHSARMEALKVDSQNEKSKNSWNGPKLTYTIATERIL